MGKERGAARGGRNGVVEGPLDGWPAGREWNRKNQCPLGPAVELAADLLDALLQPQRCCAKELLTRSEDHPNAKIPTSFQNAKTAVLVNQFHLVASRQSFYLSWRTERSLALVS